MSTYFPTVNLELGDSDEPITIAELFEIPYFNELKRDPKTGKESDKLAKFLEKRPGAVVLRKYKEGEVVVRQGEPGWTAFYVLTSRDLLNIRLYQLSKAHQADRVLGEKVMLTPEQKRQTAAEYERERADKAWLVHYLTQYIEHPKFDGERKAASKDANEILKQVDKKLAALKPGMKLSKAKDIEKECRAKAKEAQKLRAFVEQKRKMASQAAGGAAAGLPEEDELKRADQLDAEVASQYQMSQQLRAAGDLPPEKETPAKKVTRQEKAEAAEKELARREKALLSLPRTEVIKKLESTERKSDRLKDAIDALTASASRPKLEAEIQELRQTISQYEQADRAKEEIAQQFPDIKRVAGEEKIKLLETIVEASPSIQQIVAKVDAQKKAEEKRRAATVSLTIAHAQVQQTGGGLFGGIKRMLGLGRGNGTRGNGGNMPRYIPIDGPVDLDYENPVDAMYEGELFGEMSCMHRVPRSATVRADRTVYMLEMVRSVLDELMKSKSFKERLDEIYKQRVLARHLKTMPLFSSLSEDIFRRLCDGVEFEYHDHGEPIFRQGDTSDCMYVIRNGQVKILIEQDGVERVLAYQGRGEVIGEMGLLTGRPRSATCEAYGHPTILKKTRRGRVELVKITRGLYEKVLADPGSNLPELGELRTIDDDFHADELSDAIKKHDADMSLPGDDISDTEMTARKAAADEADQHLKKAAPGFLTLDRDKRIQEADRIQKNWQEGRKLLMNLRASADRPGEKDDVPKQERDRRNKAADDAEAELKERHAGLVGLDKVAKLKLADMLERQGKGKIELAQVAQRMKILEAFRLEKEFRDDRKMARALKDSASRDAGGTDAAHLADKADAALHDMQASLMELTPKEKLKAARALRDQYRKKRELARRLRADVSAIQFALEVEKIAVSRSTLTGLHESVPVDPTGQVENLGLLQGQKLMLIDLDKCTRCNECVQACLDSHADGRPRLHLTGPRFYQQAPRLGSFLVPSSCRMCLDPVCMIGCPVGSIHKGNKGEIVIEPWCIGCSLCANNCPYNSIVMHERLRNSVEIPDTGPEIEFQPKIAVVCDQCSLEGVSSGDGLPRCVWACPHEAAMRVSAPKFLTRETAVEQRWVSADEGGE